jgi:hypothetical protein
MSAQPFVQFEYTGERKPFSRLLPRNCSLSMEEGLQAKTKDPLWYLSRQWQLGEFRAKNGGLPVRADVVTQTSKVSSIQVGNTGQLSPIVDPKAPLESLVEDQANVDPPYVGAWHTKQLEYKFGIASDDTLLQAEEYFGGNLDWYDFNIDSNRVAGEKTEKFSMVPAKISFKGMPNSRWWQFEDGRVDLGNIRRPNLNILAMLLTEFALIYANDWFVLPLSQAAGTLRNIESLIVTDSFGIGSNISPIRDTSIDDSRWSMFTLSGSQGSGIENSQVFFLADRIAHALHGEALEEVTFARDEMANLVWAIEHKYDDGTRIVNRDDEEALKEPSPVEVTGLPVYRLKSHVPAHWIPYLSRRFPGQKPGDWGEIILRRGRTEITATKADPQYKGQFIKESVYLYEEEIPAVPVNLLRQWKLAVAGPEGWKLVQDNQQWKLVRVDNKKIYVWQGRTKKAGKRQPGSGLRYDYAVEKK